MKKSVWMGMIGLALAGLLAGCGGSNQSSGTEDQVNSSQSSSSSPEYVFKFGHLQGGEHPYHKGAEKFKSILEEKSQGRIQVDIFPSSQLGNGRDQIEGLQLGTIQLHVGSVAPVANFAPKMNVLSMPYLFENREHALKVLDGEIGNELSKDLESKGILNLMFWENGYRHLTNNVRPIKTAADAQGLKLRVQESPAYISFVKALGSTPTPIPFGELYTAMEQKVVDGQENPLAQIATNKFNEVQKYLTLNSHTYDPAVFLMSKLAYDQLPADLQEAVREAAKEAGDYQRQLAQESEGNFLEQLKASGMSIEENPDIDSFRKAVEPVYVELEAQVGKDLVEKIRNTK
ncbi:DctP family TRAP transporter solute-binding subunit [Ammoniphilus sp. CFH 90114]|uniref:TRAP transporter substrate-binding protein n=1 Tax=Ammoniphilus sp. CFH 90114 TaxID=2493665 RepID=UPI00100F17DC|nr:DctP family TRAP transporter solute-binding subunit [Ammoniphilus sp. CFH 90114]RXT04798.1 DctP family TRAP transporter solute-binding subunit [Ammoniphilus sp. CFH 90114]